MLKWFYNRKKLLEEIKLQEKYIKALQDELKRHLETKEYRIIGYEDLKRELAERKEEWKKVKTKTEKHLEEVQKKEKIKKNQEERI